MFPWSPPCPTLNPLSRAAEAAPLRCSPLRLGPSPDFLEVPKRSQPDANLLFFCSNSFLLFFLQSQDNPQTRAHLFLSLSLFVICSLDHPNRQIIWLRLSSDPITCLSQIGLRPSWSWKPPWEWHWLNSFWRSCVGKVDRKRIKVDNNYILHEFLADWTNIFAECRRKHHHLLPMRCIAEDLLDISTHICKRKKIEIVNSFLTPAKQ